MLLYKKLLLMTFGTSLVFTQSVIYVDDNSIVSYKINSLFMYYLSWFLK